MQEQKIQEEYEQRMEVESVRKKRELQQRERVVEERSNQAVEQMLKFRSNEDFLTERRMQEYIARKDREEMDEEEKKVQKARR